MSQDPPRLRAGDELELTIDNLAFGGKGVARHHGLVAFVPRTAPGDRVRARVTQAKKRFIEAELVEILQPSAQRREPPCPLHDLCSGCQLMHLDEGAQLDAKRHFVEDSLRRIGKFTELPAIHVAAVPDPVTRAYRTRATMTLQTHLGEWALGYYREGTHELVDIDECLVLAPPLARAVMALRKELASTTFETSSLVRLELVSDETDQVAIVARVERGSWHMLRDLLEQLRVAAVIVHYQVHRDNGQLAAEAGAAASLEVHLETPGRNAPVKVPVVPGAFAQSNVGRNRQLVDIVLDLLQPKAGEKVLDLYSGAGNYALPIAAMGAKVRAVEANEAAADALADAVLQPGLASVEAVHSQVEDAIEDMTRTGAKVDALVLNPPRTGVGMDAGMLAQLSASRIVYVSCDPPTLARDLQKITARGYRLEKILVVDMFPQTYHVETVVKLVPAG